MKRLIYLIALVTLTVACGPKSRYRSQDSTTPTLSTQGGKGGNQSPSPTGPSTRPDDLGNLPSIPEPIDEPSKKLKDEIEYLYTSRIKTEDKTEFELYFKLKNNSSPLVATVDNKSSEAVDVTAYKVSGADLRSDRDDLQIKIKTKCSEDCKTVDLELGSGDALIKVNSGVQEKKMKIAKGSEKPVDDKLTFLIDQVVTVQQTLSNNNGKFDAITILSNQGSIVLGFAKDHKTTDLIHKLVVLNGLKYGIDSAQYEGTSNEFKLVFKNKETDLGTLAFKIEAPPSAEPTVDVGTALCGLPKNEDETIELICHQQTGPGGIRMENMFVILAKVTKKPNSSSILRYRDSDDPDSPKPWVDSAWKVTVQENKSVELPHWQSTNNRAVTFALKDTPETEASEAFIVLNNTCCPTPYQVTNNDSSN